MNIRQKKYGIIGGIILTIIFGYIFFVPKDVVGEAFFGGVPTLYNVDIARFFYKQALIFDSVDGLPPPYTHYQLSRLHFIEGDLQEALDEIDREFQAYPDHTHTYYIKGLTLGYMNREKEAIDAFAKFIAYMPDSWAARNDKAWLHFRIGEIDEAMATILPAAQAHPDNPWVMNMFGVLLMNQGYYREAENAFTQALTIAEAMTKEDWGRAYPGNSPQIYGVGLEAMRASIKKNIENIQLRNTQPVQVTS
jgi:tetratricopeptide (TPR) repeat protein